MERNTMEMIARDDLGRAVYGLLRTVEPGAGRPDAWHCGPMAESGGELPPTTGLRRRNPGLAFAGTEGVSRS